MHTTVYAAVVANQQDDGEDQEWSSIYSRRVHRYEINFSSCVSLPERVHFVFGNVAKTLCHHTLAVQNPVTNIS